MAFGWLRMEAMRTAELVWCVIEISGERLSNGGETSGLHILGHGWGLSLTVRPASRDGNEVLNPGGHSCGVPSTLSTYSACPLRISGSCSTVLYCKVLGPGLRKQSGIPGCRPDFRGVCDWRGMLINFPVLPTTVASETVQQP